MPKKPFERGSQAAVPIKYAGKWVAWDAAHTQIVAQEDSLQDLWQFVKKRDIRDVTFEKIPRSDVSFVGTR